MLLFMQTRPTANSTLPNITLSIVVALLTLAAPACDDGDPLRVPTTEGPVVGTWQEATEGDVGEDDVRAFLGIPYAADTGGANRFAPPAPAPSRDEDFQATEFGLSCPATSSPLDLIFRPGEEGEDCLRLNIWAPAGNERKPVMVWIHGGGYSNGSTTSAFYNGADLARDQDVVVVSIAYRLAALGFLVTAELEDEREDTDGGAGNMALLDMRAALAWIRDNIRGFGGDPERVTIFGESAGGNAVCMLLASPGADGLFHRAIIQSGSCGANELDTGSEAARMTGAQFVADAGCDTSSDPLACLRALSTREIMDATTAQANDFGFAPFSPVIDGVVLPRSPRDALAAGEDAGVPVIVGSNRNEMTSFLFATSRPTLDELRADWESRTGSVDDANALLALYGVTDDATAALAFEAFATDRAFACSAEEIAQSLAANGRDVWLYEYQHVIGGQEESFGVGHGFEIPYVFGNLERFSPFRNSVRPRDEETSTRTQEAWGSLARDGAPGFDTDATWPAYDAGGANFMAFDEPLRVETGFRGGRCATLRGMSLL